MDIVSQSLAGLPSFLLYFVTGLALLGVFLAVYGWVTPYRELALIREGKTQTVHDCSDGGLLVAIAEMAMRSFWKFFMMA